MHAKLLLAASLASVLALAAPASAVGPVVVAAGLIYADNGAGCTDGNTVAAVLVNGLDGSGSLNTASQPCGIGGSSWAAGQCSGDSGTDVFCYRYADCPDGRGYEDAYLALGLDGSLFFLGFTCAGTLLFASGTVTRA